MEERSLRITGADRNFFNKISTTLTKLLIPTKIGINGMLISMKRNNLLKAFENYTKEDKSNYDEEELEKKYETTYTAYLESLDKYVMDSIYKKVKNNTASEFEKNALSKYYEVTSLKESEYMEYKYRKQKYLLELDYEGIVTGGKEKLIERYKKFYINKMDSIYKSILKNYSIKLADSTNVYDATKEWIYTKIFYTLEEYIQNIKDNLPELPESRKQRYLEEYNLSEKDAKLLTSSKYLSDLFEGAVKVCNNPKAVNNWIISDISRILNETETEPISIPFDSNQLGKLVILIDKGTISSSIGKKVLVELFENPRDPEDIIKEKGWIQISDEGAIKEVVMKILEANPQSIADYKAGKDKALGFLVGQAMKETKGKANPQMLNKMFLEELKK